jgi:hypothetical protein
MTEVYLLRGVPCIELGVHRSAPTEGFEAQRHPAFDYDDVGWQQRVAVGESHRREICRGSQAQHLENGSADLVVTDHPHRNELGSAKSLLVGKARDPGDHSRDTLLMPAMARMAGRAIWRNVTSAAFELPGNPAKSIPPIRPTGDQAKVGAADTKHRNSLRIRTYAPAPKHRLCTVVRLFVPGQFCFPRHGERHQVSSRTTSAQTALKTGAPDCRRKPTHDGSLNRTCGGGRPPGGGVLIEDRRKQISKCPDGLTGTNEIAEEPAARGGRMFRNRREVVENRSPQPLFRPGPQKKLGG